MKSDSASLVLHLPIKFKKHSDDFIRSYMTIYAMKQGYYTDEIIVGIA